MKHLLLDRRPRRRRHRIESARTSPTTSSRSAQRPDPEGAGAARQDRGLPVLRGLDPHPPVVRDRGQAPVGRHHELQRRLVVRSTRASASATRSRPSRRWASTRSSCATVQRARRSRSLAGSTASVDQRRRRLARAPDPGAARLLHDPRRPRPSRGFDGLRIAIVGDIKHSRVARSDVLAFTALGAEVTLVAPPTLLPPSLDGWPVDVSCDLDAVLPMSTSLYLLRMQRERMDEALLPSAARVHGRCTASPPRGPRASAARAGDAPGPDEPRRRDRRRGRPSCPARSSSTRSPTASRCAWPCCSTCSDRAPT